MKRCRFLAAMTLLWMWSGGSSIRASVGSDCVLNSDCREPLLCIEGTCHQECLSSRDCAPGMHCDAPAEGGAPSCVPLNDRCATDADCDATPGGLE